MNVHSTERINRSLALMCAVDLRPLSFVEGVGFRYFANQLNPSYKVPCRNTVGNYLTKLYNDAKTEMIGELRDQHVSLTTDLWTSNAMQGYITITEQHIDLQWKMHSNVLGTRLFSDRHTGQNIASEIHNLCSEFLNTNNIVHLTTDNAANMLVAAEKLGISHSGCFAHSLQLALQDALKLAPIAKALGAGRRLVTFFNYSVLATSALKQKQVQMATEAQKEQVKKGPIIAKNLIQDCPTRWNSALEMVQRLVELRVPIYAVLVDATIVKSGERFDIDDVFWDTMHTIIPILHPFAEATEILGKEDLPTGSSIYPLLTDMMEDLKTTEEDKALAKQLKKTISMGLVKRFKFLSEDGGIINEGLNSSLLKASALDPRYKSLKFLTESQRKELHANIAEEIRRSSNTAEVKKEPEADEVTEPPVKKPIMSKVLSYVMGDTVDLTEGSDVSSVEEELADFVREPLRPPNPLQWWSVYRSRFPSIASVARKYLSIPGTSVPSERTFSTAGLTVSKLRASLNPEHVDQLVFLNKNLKSAVKANMTVPSDFLPASDALPAVTVTCTPSSAASTSSQVSNPVYPQLPGLPSSNVKEETP